MDTPFSTQSIRYLNPVPPEVGPKKNTVRTKVFGGQGIRWTPRGGGGGQWRGKGLIPYPNRCTMGQRTAIDWGSHTELDAPKAVVAGTGGADCGEARLRHPQLSHNVCALHMLMGSVPFVAAEGACGLLGHVSFCRG